MGCLLMKSATKRLVDKCRTINFCWRVLNQYGHATTTAAEAVQTSGLDGASWSRATAPYFGRQGQFAPLPTGPRGSKVHTENGEYLLLMEQQFQRDGFSAITWYTHGPHGLNLWEILLAENAGEIYRLAGTKLRSTVDEFARRSTRASPLLESASDLCYFLGGVRAAWLTVQPHLPLPLWADPSETPLVLRQFLNFNPPLAEAILELISVNDRDTIAAVYASQHPNELVNFDFVHGYVDAQQINDGRTVIELNSGHVWGSSDALATINRLATPKRNRTR